MTDAIKIFIQNHREAFDAALPGAQGWPSLERMLNRLPNTDALEKQLFCDRLLLDSAIPPETIWLKIEDELEGRKSKQGIEEFIRDNRESFDSALPADHLWTNIASALPKQKAKIVSFDWQRSLLRMAAAIALVVAGIGGGIWYERHGAAPPVMAMSEVSNEYAELEQFYQRDINTKSQKLATFTGGHAAEVGEDLEHLDKIMQELRHELANVPSGNREQVVRAMIENYKAKTAILQRVLERLEEHGDEGNNINRSNEIKNI